MENDTVYKWTFSVIAMLDRDEDENGHLEQWEAYNEFEDSITSVENPSKNINFFIYLYDVIDKKVYIKRAEIIDNRYFLKIVEYYPLPDFYTDDNKHLICFFERYVANSYTQNTHFLITWGHAAGAGYFSTIVNSGLQNSLRDKYLSHKEEFDKLTKILKSIRFVKAHLSIDKNLINLEKLDFFKNDKLNLTPREKRIIKNHAHETIKCLSAVELASIIKEGLRHDASFIKQGKIDYLLCVSCYTQMIETGVILSNVVNVMIAPVTGISFFAYNYRSLFKTITENPSADAILISNQLVNTYLAKYSEKYMAQYVNTKNALIYSIQYRQLVSFSAVNLSKYDSIKQGIKDFVDFVVDGGKIDYLFNKFSVEKLDAIKYARGRCLDINFFLLGSGIVDFNNLLMKFFELYTDIEIKVDSPAYLAYLKVFTTYSDSFVIAQYYPGNYTYYYDDSRGFILSLCAGTFGVFLPPSASLTPGETNIWHILDKENINLNFWNETGWKKLIDKID